MESQSVETAENHERVHHVAIFVVYSRVPPDRLRWVAQGFPPFADILKRFLFLKNIQSLLIV